MMTAIATETVSMVMVNIINSIRDDSNSNKDRILGNSKSGSIHGDGNCNRVHFITTVTTNYNLDGDGNYNYLWQQ